MRKSRVFVMAVCLGYFVVPGAASSGQGSLEIGLRSAPFHLTEGKGGQRLEIEGFDYLKEPGRPMLPEKELLVLLPPGARALSLEIDELEEVHLPGRFTIEPTPPLLPLAGMDGSAALRREMAEWEQTRWVAYSDDRVYPADAVRIAGTGTLREYAYVRLSFRPLGYRPSSGHLIHHPRARVRIRYALPDPGSGDVGLVQELLRHTSADGAAERLFVNYEDLRDLYLPKPGEATLSPDDAVYDYVIITTVDLVGAVTASSFPGWKTSLGFHLRTVLVTDPEIAGQPGADLAERIRNFLRANYATWGIEHVLLVGGSQDVPMRYCYPDPENHLHDPADPGTGPGSVPTDAYYADLSFSDAESWDLDGDGFHGEYGQDDPEFLTEVTVGRIPTSDVSRITYTLDKLVRVEQDSGAWKRHALHAGAILFFANQDFSGIPLRDGAVFVDEVERHFMQGWTMSRYSERSGIVTSPFPWPALTLTAFINDWRLGSYGIVNWAGHGWPDTVARTVWSWDDGDGVPETDGSDGMTSESFINDWPILDDDYPSIVCAVSCNVGYPEPNAWGNLGINLLTDPTRGAAAAVVSSSRYAAVSGDWPALPGGAESLCYEFNRFLIDGPGGARSLGAALQEAKYFSHVTYGWDNDYEYRNLYNYNLYGDPSMDWRGAGPRTGELLRNSDVSQLDPVTPPLNGCLPLDPVADLHIPDFVAGDVDPDPASGCPLVFYAIDAPVRIWLGRTPTGEIRIDF